jgi:hypothetical protein
MIIIEGVSVTHTSEDPLKKPFAKEEGRDSISFIL